MHYTLHYDTLLHLCIEGAASLTENHVLAIMRTNNEVFMLKPLGKRVLIKPIEMKAGVLFVSGAKPVQYEVVAIGDDVTKVKPTDVIYLEKHYGAEIEHDKQKFLVVEEASILAKID